MPPVLTKTGQCYETPLFLPVFEYNNDFITIGRLKDEFSIRGLITNGYFLYKKRDLKPIVLEKKIKTFLDFEGMVMTDSGAFQQFSGPLYLSNKKIIAFQQEIGADVISPLDLITTPGDNRTNATKKLKATLKRIKEGLPIATESVLAGVQQGGRFLDLRGEALESLVEMGVDYIALGSLVPFFTKNHHIEFICRVLQQARQIVPPDIPLHLYGAGDPLELPFYMALGCNIFDSSSFIHYARDGWLMTPYGAIKGPEVLVRGDYTPNSPYYQAKGEAIWQDAEALAAHNLWVILTALDEAKRRIVDGTIGEYLAHVIEVHQRWFPESRLEYSWQVINESG